MEFKSFKNNRILVQADPPVHVGSFWVFVASLTTYAILKVLPLC